MRSGEGKLFDALAIRDTEDHESDAITVGRIGDLLFAAENGLNQTVSIQYQGSFDNEAWHDLQAAVSVTTTEKAADTLGARWPYVRAVATCAVAPASGTLTLHYAYNEGIS